jgi:DNA (cytosine-5)-methyltransferase 1
MKILQPIRSAQVVDTSGKPTVISTFAGTGGSSLGYHWAGFKELLAIDFDAHAVQCFKLNFPDVPVWHRSVIDVTGDEIMDFCNIKPGELDVFDGSPPCQGFSTAGKREVRDPRNDLFAHYYRLVTELQPKVFVMENVSGMVKGTMKGRFIEIMNVLKTGNYNVKCKLMNAMYYGVPQARQRLIFIGVRKDLNKAPVFPTASNRIVTTKQAIGKLKREELGFYPPITNAFIKSILSKMKAGESGSDHHPKQSYFNCKRLYWTRPSQTLTKTFSGFIHPIEERHISINEAKLLCSFPIEWKLGADFHDAWARLGNAVMPKFMQAIAETIKTKILT